MVTINTQLLCFAFTIIITTIITYAIFVTSDDITGNMKLTRNISIFSTNNTNNETVDQTADSKGQSIYFFISRLVSVGLAICGICVSIFINNVRIINYIHNGYRNTMYRLRNWRRYFRRNRPEPVVRLELNGRIEILKQEKIE